MKLIVDIVDPENQPKVYVDDKGRINKIELEAPFVYSDPIEDQGGVIVTAKQKHICPECEQEKRKNEFYTSKRSRLGIQRICIVCDKKRRRQRHEAKRDADE